MKNWCLSSTLCLLALICCGTCFAQNATSNKPSNQEQPDWKKICPTVSVSCPNDPKLNELMEFTATVAGGDPNLTPIYNWTVSSGVIIEGQGTRVIRVKIDGYVTVTSTLELGGFDPTCSRTASCSTMICPPLPPLERFDAYGLLPFDQVRTKLDHFGTALQNQPGAMAYIRGYSRKQGSKSEALKAIDDAKQYLVEKFDFDEARIRTAEGEATGEFLIELWIIPTGSPLPTDDADKNP